MTGRYLTVPHQLSTGMVPACGPSGALKNGMGPLTWAMVVEAATGDGGGGGAVVVVAGTVVVGSTAATTGVGDELNSVTANTAMTAATTAAAPTAAARRPRRWVDRPAVAGPGVD